MLSHLRTWEERKDAPAKEAKAKKEAAPELPKMEKTTLGDLGVLADLKASLETPAEEKPAKKAATKKAEKAEAPVEEAPKAKKATKKAAKEEAPAEEAPKAKKTTKKAAKTEE